MLKSPNYILRIHSDCSKCSFCS